ncbi:MAG: hypothetical protein Rubg2KO_01140 [Rubricoccaceae bacterium]
MPDRQPDAPQPISRRESLKRAAGALALGLGAPMSALAASKESAPKTVLGFYKIGDEAMTFTTSCCKESDLLHQMEIPEEIAEMLMQPETLGFLKLGDIKGERSVAFQVRRSGRRGER